MSTGSRWRAALAAERAFADTRSIVSGAPVPHKPFEGKEHLDGVLSGEDLQEYVAHLNKHVQSMTLAIQEHVESAPNRSRRPTVTLTTDSKTNPSRSSLALDRLGLIPNYSEIGDFAVAVIGLGRTGAPVADILARAGVGRLLLVDSGDVHSSHLCGHVYRPEHVGMAKVQAVRLVLRTLNPGVEVRGEQLDVRKEKSLGVLRRRLLAFHSGDDARESTDCGPPVDLLCCCLDAHDSRAKINQLCLELGIPFASTRLLPGAEQSAFTFVIPGHTACLHCADEVPGDGQDAMDGSAVKADFPGEALMLAGIAAHTALKFLLEFGEVTPQFVHRRGEGRSYDSEDLSWGCYSLTSGPNPMCNVVHCRARQHEVDAAASSEPSCEEDQEEEEVLPIAVPDDLDSV